MIRFDCKLGRICIEGCVTARAAEVDLRTLVVDRDCGNGLVASNRSFRVRQVHVSPEQGSYREHHGGYRQCKSLHRNSPTTNLYLRFSSATAASVSDDAILITSPSFHASLREPPHYSYFYSRAICTCGPLDQRVANS